MRSALSSLARIKSRFLVCSQLWNNSLASACSRVTLSLGLSTFRLEYISRQSIPMLCLSGVVDKVCLHAPCPVVSWLHSGSLKILHAVAATSGTCPFPQALTLSSLEANPSSTPRNSLANDFQSSVDKHLLASLQTPCQFFDLS